MNVLDRAAELRSKGEAFAIATVVRTVSVTAAKAGAKAIIGADGALAEGWIGGGCARAAVIQAAKQCLDDGRSRLISIAPKEGLDVLGVAPGEDRDGVTFARNACPSQGTMDIFVEPILPLPRLLILGASPVAAALARLAPTSASRSQSRRRRRIGGVSPTTSSSSTGSRPRPTPGAAPSSSSRRKAPATAQR